jgi:hypothetical protein
MKRVSLLLAASLVAACDGSTIPTAPVMEGGTIHRSISTDPGVSFEVTGFTYGPNLTDATEPSCKELYSWTKDSVVYEDKDPSTVADASQPWPRRIVFYEDKLTKSCGIGSTPGGDAFLGGTISITGSDTYGGIGLGSTDARWDRTRTISNFPLSATVILTAWPIANGDCPNPTFDYWIMDNNWGNRITSNPLYIAAADIAGHRVQGEFFCHKDQPPPPPPPDEEEPPTCDLPPCDEGGDGLRVMTVEKQRPSLPDRRRAGKLRANP